MIPPFQPFTEKPIPKAKLGAWIMDNLVDHTKPHATEVAEHITDLAGHQTCSAYEYIDNATDVINLKLTWSIGMDGNGAPDNMIFTPCVKGAVGIHASFFSGRARAGAQLYLDAPPYSNAYVYHLGAMALQRGLTLDHGAQITRTLKAASVSLSKTPDKLDASDYERIVDATDDAAWYPVDPTLYTSSDVQGKPAPLVQALSDLGYARPQIVQMIDSFKLTRSSDIHMTWVRVQFAGKAQNLALVLNLPHVSLTPIIFSHGVVKRPSTGASNLKVVDNTSTTVRVN